MSRRRSGFQEESPLEQPSEVAGMSTSTLSLSTSEQRDSSGTSVPSEASTPSTPTDPHIMLIFSKEGIRISLSDDMHRVSPAILERAYMQAMREVAILRTRAVHNLGKVKDAA